MPLLAATRAAACLALSAAVAVTIVATVAAPPVAASAAPASAAARSPWAASGAAGRLVYKTTERGDRILDFSFAGYGGGGIALPSSADVPDRQIVRPSGGDDTTAIQAAINAVSAREPVKGFRGAVRLAPGTFTCSAPLRIPASGVVLRGSGSGDGGTTITLAGSPHVCFTLAGAAGRSEPARATAAVRITDDYVPSGARSFHVADASGFHAGDTILLRHPITPAWVHFMGMDTLVRNGKKETWVAGEIRTERTVQSVIGSQLTLTIPLSDSLDARFLRPEGATVARAPAESGRIDRVGVESIRVVSPPQAIGIDQPQYQAVRMSGVEDGWLRDIAIEDTIDSVGIGDGCRRVTVEGVTIRHTVATTGSAKPADFSAGGTQILFDRCSVQGDNLFYFVTGARVTGPNVLLNCTFRGRGWIQPHQRWATGLLVDGCRVPEGSIDFMNRGIMGSGHGWTIGWAVAWNCFARSFTIQQPPGVVNWAIGCTGGQRMLAGMPGGGTAGSVGSAGPKLPEGTYDFFGTPVVPVSLYLAQLRERLGPQAVKNIGY